MRSIRSVVLLFAAAVGPAAFAQAVPTCNGRTATIVAITPGVITGTNGDDVIVGTSGDDKIFGLAGNDTICGGGGNDQITGGTGNDAIFGEGGNDTIFWNPGDGSDLVEGGTETDSLVISGANIGENIGLSANGVRLRFTRDVASIVLDVGGIERVSFEARGGSDLISVGSLVGTGVQQVALELRGSPESGTPDGAADSIFVFGTAGNDQITLSGTPGVVNIAGAGPAIQIRNPDPTLDTLTVSGAEGQDRIDAQALAAGVMNLIIDGGPGNDSLRGSAGADTLTGGEGDDTIEWPLGTPADIVTGDLGVDTLVVIGTTAGDHVIFGTGGLDAQVINQADGATLTASVEQVVFVAKSGPDSVTVNTAPASVFQKITIDLRPSPASTTGDSAADTVTVNGTLNADSIVVTGAAGNATVTGMAPTVVIQGAESVRDMLVVNGASGDDTINAAALAADAIKLTVRGGQGADVVAGGAGDDLFMWFPGDGSDRIDGGLGNDTLQISGANIGESIGLSANGTRLLFTRDVASIALDVDGVERVSFAALGGADTITISDLSATATRQVSIDLAALGVGDGAQDTIAISAHPGAVIGTSVAASSWTFSWSPVRIVVTGVEPGVDRMVLQTPLVAAPAVVAETTGTASGP